MKGDKTRQVETRDETRRDKTQETKRRDETRQDTLGIAFSGLQNAE